MKIVILNDGFKANIAGGVDLGYIDSAAHFADSTTNE